MTVFLFFSISTSFPLTLFLSLFVRVFWLLFHACKLLSYLSCCCCCLSIYISHGGRKKKARGGKRVSKSVRKKWNCLTRPSLSISFFLSFKSRPTMHARKNSSVHYNHAPATCLFFFFLLDGFYYLCERPDARSRKMENGAKSLKRIL